MTHCRNTAGYVHYTGLDVSNSVDTGVATFDCLGIEMLLQSNAKTKTKNYA